MSLPEVAQDAVPQIAAGHRMQFEPAQDCYVLLYPEGMVTLNPSGAEILGRCDGKRSVGTLCSDLAKEFDDEDIADDVRQFITLAVSHGWVTLR